MEEPKRFTAAEVFSHSSQDDCWLTIYGKVYDVTKFLEDHPGGDEVLVHASADGDATQSFEDVGHSSTAMSMMNNYLIGVLDGYDASKVPEKAQVIYPKTTPAQQQPTYSLVDYIIPLLILGLAFASWYYLTYMNNA